MQNNRIVSRDSVTYYQSKMTAKEKLQILVKRKPELKEVLRDISFEQIRKGIDCVQDKIFILGSEKEFKNYLLCFYLKYGYKETSVFTTQQILDGFLHETEDSVPVSQMVNDLVIVKDTRAVVNHKQRETLLAQVIEQNRFIIVHGDYPQKYKGMFYPTDLIQIPVLSYESKTVKEDEFIF